MPEFARCFPDLLQPPCPEQNIRRLQIIEHHDDYLHKKISMATIQFWLDKLLIHLTYRPRQVSDVDPGSFFGTDKTGQLIGQFTDFIKVLIS